MLAVREGDLDKLGYLFEKYHVQLYNVYLRQTGDRQTSEDLVQEVFLRMLKYRHTYRGEGKFTTWMFSIAHNVKADHYRKARHKRDFTDEVDALVSTRLNPEELTEKTGRHEILYRAMDRLSDEKREVLVLSRFQQLKYEEISEILGCPVGTIKARVFHAIRDLRSFFDETRDGATQ
jgi:RNA polymerase sigma-70 factor (ECF subfamily)